MKSPLVLLQARTASILDFGTASLFTLAVHGATNWISLNSTPQGGR